QGAMLSPNYDPYTAQGTPPIYNSPFLQNPVPNTRAVQVSYPFNKPYGAMLSPSYDPYTQSGTMPSAGTTTPFLQNPPPAGRPATGVRYPYNSPQGNMLSASYNPYSAGTPAQAKDAPLDYSSYQLFWATAPVPKNQLLTSRGGYVYGVPPTNNPGIQK